MVADARRLVRMLNVSAWHAASYAMGISEGNGR
jgi:hypothetical protein